MKNPFIGRAEELDKIGHMLDTPGSAIILIYGRRRIGKSLLIKKSLSGKNYLSFEGLENRPKKDQIDNFLLQLSFQLGKNQKYEPVKNWREAFLILYKELKKNPCPIVLDEFQWMANYQREIVSDLKMVWDQYLSDLEGVTLFLCGSIASFMIEKVLHSSALYGRIDLQLHLKGFSLLETCQMTQSQRGIVETLETHMFTGGVPKYIDLLKQYDSLYIGLDELAFSDSGYFFSEYQRIFTSHFGSNPDFESIIKVLAEYPYGLRRKELSENAGISSGGVFTKHLNDLEAAGFISGVAPVGKTQNSKLRKYYLSDAYLRFYFAFIEPNRTRIQSSNTEGLFIKISQSPAFQSWKGIAFEYVCLQHAKHIASLLGFGAVDYSYGPFFASPSRKKPGVQVDLLYDRADNVITLCEIKYTKEAPGIELIEEVEKRAAVLQKAFPTKTVQNVLITLTKPTRNLTSQLYFRKIICAEELFKL